MPRATMAVYLFSATATFAGPFDGQYAPRAVPGDPLRWCPEEPIFGNQIRDNVLSFGEVTCHLVSPVRIRGLPGTLFDGACLGEEGQGEWSQRFLLYETHDGLLILGKGDPYDFVRCPM